MKKRVITYCFALLLLAGLTALSNANEQPLVDALLLCKQESSPLLRLDCYDNIMKYDGTLPSKPAQLLTSKGAQLAIDQESKRGENTTQFIVTEQNMENPTIVITTIALGMKPPRPILAFSCIDNITRMQLIFTSPLKSKITDLTLKTDKTEFQSSWFIRDNGYIFEASRGLPGIKEIQQLLQSNTLAIKSNNKEINGLNFSISGLNNAIVPLRTACRW